MREIRPSGSAGGAGQPNAPFLPRSGLAILDLEGAALSAPVGDRVIPCAERSQWIAEVCRA